MAHPNVTPGCALRLSLAALPSLLPTTGRRLKRLCLLGVQHWVQASEVGTRRRREFCHFDDTPLCLSLLKHLLKVQGGWPSNDSTLADG